MHLDQITPHRPCKSHIDMAIKQFRLPHRMVFGRQERHGEHMLRIIIGEADSDAALRQGMPVTIAVDAGPASGTRVEER